MMRRFALLVSVGTLVSCGGSRDSGSQTEAELLAENPAAVHRCLGLLPPGRRRALCVREALEELRGHRCDAGIPSDGGNTDSGNADVIPPEDAGPPVCAQASPDYVFATIGAGAVPTNVQAIATGEVWGISVGQLQRWSGASWADVSAPFSWSSSLGLIRGSGASDIWVTNGGATIARWDGASWTDVSDPSAPAGSIVTEIRVRAPRDAWMVNLLALPDYSYQVTLHHWDGTQWTEIAPPSDAQPLPLTVHDVWATAADDAWMLGRHMTSTGSNEDLVLHWDGVALHRQFFEPPSTGTHWLSELWASNARDVWIAGATDNLGTLFHFDGSAWTEVAFPPANGSFHNVWGWCAGNVWAAAPAGIWHYDGTAWAQVRSIAYSFSSTAISGTGPDDVWVSGMRQSGNVTMRWQPASPAACGNEVTEPGEDCDPPNGTTCDAQCKSIPIVCGNGIVQPGEDCDPPNGTTCDAQCKTITPVCGNGVVEPGETCEYGLPLCQSCQLTACGQCFTACGFPGMTCGADVCSGLSPDDTKSCEALVTCMSPGLAICNFRSPPIGCYCSNATCSLGANGPCAAQVQTLAHSTDPATVVQQIQNPQTPVGRVFTVMNRFGASSCGRSCSGL